MKKTTLILTALSILVCCACAWQGIPGNQTTKTDAFKIREQSRKVLIAIPYQPLPFTLDFASMSVPLGKGFTPEDLAISGLVNINLGIYSRNPMLNYEFVAKLHIATDRDVIVMRTANGAGDDIYPAYYSLCVMDSRGKIYSRTHNLAYLRSPMEIRTAVISKDSILCHEIEQQWEKDPLMVGYKGNRVAKSIVEDTTVYKMNKDGQYEEED